MKKKKTPRTTKLRRASIITGILSFLMTFGPAIVYTFIAIFNDSLASEKIGLALSVVIAVMLTLISIVNKHLYKSRLWIILIGLYLCIKNFVPCLVIFAITQMLDELIFAPIHERAKNRYIINKELDLRGE